MEYVKKFAKETVGAYIDNDTIKKFLKKGGAKLLKSKYFKKLTSLASKRLKKAVVILAKKILKKFGKKLAMKILKTVASKLGKKILFMLLGSNPEVLAVAAIVEIGWDIAVAIKNARDKSAASK